MVVEELLQLRLGWVLFVPLQSLVLGKSFGACRGSASCGILDVHVHDFNSLWNLLRKCGVHLRVCFHANDIFRPKGEFTRTSVPLSKIITWSRQKLTSALFSSLPSRWIEIILIQTCKDFIDGSWKRRRRDSVSLLSSSSKTSSSFLCKATLDDNTLK